MKFDTDDLKASLKNYQQKASDQFKDFAENDWPDIKDHVTEKGQQAGDYLKKNGCLLYTSPSPRDGLLSRMPSSA